MHRTSSAYPSYLAARRTAATREVFRIGSWKIPVMVIAWGLSGVLHAGVFTTSYFATWQPASSSPPRINLARGEHASQVQVILVPWPEPASEEPEYEEVSVQPTPRRAEPLASASAVSQPPDKPKCDPANRDQERQPVVQVDHLPLPSTAKPCEEAVVLDEVVEEAPSLQTQSRFPRAAAVTERVPPDIDEPNPVEDKPEGVTEQKKVEAKQLQVAATAEPPTSREPSSAATPGVETGVEILDLPRPSYPLVSRRLGEQGVVLLHVEVFADGTVGKIGVLRDPGFPRLKAAAIAAVRQARFEPATRLGRPVSATVRIPFRFVLR